MTIWGVAGMWSGFLVYAVAWLHGGRAERFGAAMLILHCMGTVITFKWVIGGLHLPRMTLDYVRLLVFVWFCFRSDRWWPFVVVAASTMLGFLHLATLLNPAFFMAAASAEVGLGYLTDLALLSGVLERIMAGEAPAGHAAWARAVVATAGRKKRKGPGRRPDAGAGLFWKERTEGP